MIFGDLIDGALADKMVHVVADFVDEELGFYWDISDPDKYFDLLRRYYSTGDAIPGLARKQRRVFIGHGHSDCWKELRDFLRDRLDLGWEEFNRIPAAGKNTQSRLVEMLDGVDFAFLVMTPEEEDASGGLRARDNVIHEIGLFQGRLGFERAVILLEEGCEEFSNITGLTQIRFARGNLMAKSDDIRRVLEREGLLQPPR
jgi:predicted nucleotide-binding protein